MVKGSCTDVRKRMLENRLNVEKKTRFSFFVSTDKLSCSSRVAEQAKILLNSYYKMVRNGVAMA